MAIPGRAQIENIQRSCKHCVKNLRSPNFTLPGQEEVKHTKYKAFCIQPQWWEPVAWWIKNTKWTEHDISDRQGHFERTRRRCTWAELCLAFQIQTSYNFPADKIDLKSKKKSSGTCAARSCVRQYACRGPKWSTSSKHGEMRKA